MPAKKTHAQFINDLFRVNPNIVVIGKYNGKEQCISVECSVCGYIWEPKAGSLLRGTGCPNCAGNAPKNTEQFIKEINERRCDITILGQYSGANKGILVRCNACGNEWTPTPSKLLAGRGCPKCSISVVTEKRIKKFIEKEGSLMEKYPELLKEWDYNENIKRNLDPNKLTISSNRKASWICNRCGFVFDAIISNRTRLASGCPVCAGKIVLPGVNDLMTIAPGLMRDWDYEKNDEELIKPSMLSKGSETTVNWKCISCGYRWRAKVYSRVAGSGCPNCAKETHTSLPELTILYYMKKIDPNVINTYQPEWLKPSEIDVFIPSLQFGIEYDGEGFHNNPQKDEKKDDLCKAHGIILLHVREPKCPQLKPESLVYYRLSKKEEQLDEMICAIMAVINDKCGTSFSINPSFKRDREQIFDCYLSKRKTNSIAMLPDAMLDWDYKKNKALDPFKISRGSNIRVWWKCHICGNETYGMVSDHQKHACSMCARNRQKKKILKYTIDGQFLAEYGSVAEASHSVGISDSTLINAIKRGNGICVGYKWEYKDNLHQ